MLDVGVRGGDCGKNGNLPSDNQTADDRRTDIRYTDQQFMNFFHFS